MESIAVSVVIVGSGGAGLRCAIHLREQGLRDILIIGDRKFTDAHTIRARGGINAALGTLDHNDTPLLHAADTYREAQYIAHPALVEKLTTQAPAAIDDLLRRGAQFHTELDGTLTQRFFGAHTYRRTCFSGDQTGQEMIRVLCARAHELGIPHLEHTYVYKLCTENNKVTGVLAVDTTTTYQISAGTVVFATGGFSNIYQRSSSRNGENFGDGIGMAFRAGAMIGDIELVQFHPTGLLYPEEHFGELVTEAVRGEGGTLTNVMGERFMSQYDPEKMELSTRDVVARAIFSEIKAGKNTPKGGVRLDISHKSAAYIKDRLPKMYSMILEYNGVDITKAPVEVAPTTHYTMGGIRFDAETMKTSIENFYVAGECTMGVHGANRLGGNSLMETMVFGKHVAETILSQKLPATSTPHPIDDAISETHTTDNGLHALRILQELRERVWILGGIVRNKQELLTLSAYLEQTKTAFYEQGIQPLDSHFSTVVAYKRLQTVLDLASLVAYGANERKESRGAHFRSDYPTIDPTYRKNLLHMYEQGSVNSFRKDLPEPSPALQHELEKTPITPNYGHLE